MERPSWKVSTTSEPVDMTPQVGLRARSHLGDGTILTTHAPAAFTPNRRTVAAASRLRLSGAAVASKRLTQLAALLPLAVLSSGCASAVTGRIQPAHFQFTTVVPHTEPGEGGWRAACVHAQITNGDTREPYSCIIGVEMPIESRGGPYPPPLPGVSRQTAPMTPHIPYSPR